MADLYLTPAEKYTAALGGFYYGDLPEPGTVYTQLIKDILDGSTPDKEPKNILARFIYSLYISDLGDPYPRYELAKLLYWKLHNITPTKSGSVLTVTIDGKEDYMTINTDLSRLWYKVLFGSKTDVITEFPYIFNTMQNKLSDWELFGNTVHSGTPTPDSPVMPQGTGERTGNLAYGRIENANITSDGTMVRTTGYNVAIARVEVGKVYTANSYVLAFYTDEPTIGSVSYNSLRIVAIVGQPTTVTAPITGYVAFRLNIGEQAMLNTGSTPLPYEPYGYKIPISSASTTTPVYLGEVESTRQIKKLVLTGEETLTSGSVIGQIRTPLTGAIDSLGLCTHYIPKTSYGGAFPYIRIRSNTLWFEISPDGYETKEEALTDFKSYLAAQYAAGTPVTVWYVLATEETGIVNEPLMKIGDYADSVSRTQTGIDIPTVIGQNTLDVLTTVKPSSMRIEYTSSDENRSRSKRISLLKSPLKKRLIK